MADERGEPRSPILNELGMDPDPSHYTDDDAYMTEFTARMNARLNARSPGTDSERDRIFDQAIDALGSLLERGRLSVAETHDRSLGIPAASSIPIELVGEFDLDPLEFTLELERPATPDEIDAVTAWVEQLGNAEAIDDEDHVSFWSEAEVGFLPGTGAPMVSWWFDAAAASPATIRRLMEGTVRSAAGSSLPVVRLLVGHTDQMS